MLEQEKPLKTAIRGIPVGVEKGTIKQELQEKGRLCCPHEEESGQPLLNDGCDLGAVRRRKTDSQDFEFMWRVKGNPLHRPNVTDAEHLGLFNTGRGAAASCINYGGNILPSTLHARDTR